MSVCEKCGRLKQGRDQVGPYCEPCITQAIDRVFVHAADQPAGNIPEVHDEEIESTPYSPESDDAQTVTSRTLSHGTPRHARTTRDLARSQRRPASQRYASVNMRPIQQMQMLSDFLNTHFPTAEARAGLANRRSYLAALPDIDIASTPLLRVAIDTLCFAHIGSKTGDLRLVRESQASYGKVLNSLIKATRAPADQVPYIEPKAVIISIMLLCLYEDSIPVPQKAGSWQSHYWGANQMLRAYGASFLNMAEPLDRLIYWNLRMPTFFVGVARRKAVILGEPEWLDLAESNVESRGPLTEFYRIVMKIPALLERTDDLMLSNTRPKDIEAICNDICKVRQDVKDWYADKTRRTHGNYLEVPTVLIADDEPGAFDLENEEHCFMTSSDTFSSFFRYQTPGYLVKNHTYNIMIGLLLDCTLLRLLHFRPAAASYLKDHSSQDIERTAFEKAKDICRSAYHYSNFHSLPYVDFLDFLVEMAQNFFEEIGAMKELGWCQAVRCATELRRERIKKTIQPRTLCRMAEAGPGFAAATRFRSRNIAQG